MPLTWARGGVIALAVAAVATSARTARADEPADPKIACATHAERGQRAKLDGHLRAAREDFLACAQDTCPAAVRRPCSDWLSETERSIPTIVVLVRAPGGEVSTPSRAWIDDEEIDVSSGRAAPLDPGEHVVRVRAATGEADVRVVAIEGRKAEVVHVPVRGPTKAMPSEPEHPRATPALTPGRWVAVGIGAAGVLGLGSAGLFALSARSRYDDSAPFCTGDACDPTGLAMRSEAIDRADLATGITAASVGALAAAVIVWIVTAPAR